MIFEPLLKAWKASEIESILEAFVAGKQVRVSGLKGSAPNTSSPETTSWFCSIH